MVIAALEGGIGTQRVCATAVILDSNYFAMHPLNSFLALALAHFVTAQKPVTPERPIFSEEPISEQPECPVVLPLPSGLTQRVVGGQSLQHDDLLFHAWVLKPGAPGNRALCSAARLSKHWVLTAAHCDVMPWWNISLSSPSLRDPGVPARIEHVYNHPNYTDQTPDAFDVALLRIVLAASEPDEVHMLRLNAAPLLPVDGAFVRVSGYGIRSFEIDERNASRPFPENIGDLHFVDIPVFPFSSCSQAYFGLVSEGYHLCSGYEHHPCSPCSGDSGGPVFQYDKQGHAVQVAVHTGAIGCTRPGFPAVGVRVDAVLPWFKEVGAVFETGEPEQVFRQSDIAGGSDAAQGDVSQPTASAAPVMEGVNDSDDGLSAPDVQQSQVEARSRWALVGISVGSVLGIFSCVGGWFLVAKKRMNTETSHALAA